jgi:hypothetical protein
MPAQDTTFLTTIFPFVDWASDDEEANLIGKFDKNPKNFQCSVFKY